MERVIPKKNYIILIVILLFTLVLTFYFYLWFRTYEKERLNYPVMGEHLFQINYSEIDNYLIENPDTIIYVSKVGNEKTRAFEKKLIVSINKYQLKNDMLYLDISNLSSSSIKDKYIIDGVSINNVPNIMVFKDGKLESIYTIDLNNYDCEKIISYLVNYVI